MITKEQYNRLKPFEEHFICAKYNWTRIKGIELKELISIASEFGITIADRNCGVCVVRFLKDVSKVYDSYKEANEKQTNKKGEKK